MLGDEVIKNASAMSLTPPTKDHEPVQGNLVLVDHSGCERTPASNDKSLSSTLHRSEDMLTSHSLFR